jgi:hypothetical protein
LRRVAALQLAGNVMTRLVYIPTEFNPSDLASRGVRTRVKNCFDRNKLRDEKHNAKRRRYENRLVKEICRSPCRNELLELIGEDPTFWHFQWKK